MSEQQDFAGKVVLVTGAAQGIGRVVALVPRVARKSRCITVPTRRRLKRRWRGLLARGIPYNKPILTDPIQARQLVETAVAQHGRLDVLVNNAAIFAAHPIAKVSYDEWQTAWTHTQRAICWRRQRQFLRGAADDQTGRRTHREYLFARRVSR
ncbi:MAG: SDR family NAD(P)-dependent oxidoreductase [Acidobacteriota bacterium]